MLLAILPCLSYAAQAPDSGSTLESLKRQKQNLPQKHEKKPMVETYKQPIEDVSDHKIYVSRFRISGQDLFSNDELISLIAEGHGKELSLKGLQTMADRISDYFHKKGYILARAYIPAQDIVEGQVEIAVLVGRYDQIMIRNETQLANSAIRLQLGKVRSGSYVERANLERALWLIGDLAGADAKATLAPGTNPGTSDLIIKILPKDQKGFGSISVDNYGNRFTGRSQLTVTDNLDNLNNHGDRLMFNGTTTGNELASGDFTYQLPALLPGGKLQAQYSQMQYELGDIYAALNATGTAKTVSLAYLQTIKRSQRDNLYSQLSVGKRTLEDHMGGDLSSQKHTYLVTAALNGDSLDKWGGGGANMYSLSFTHGTLNVDVDTAGVENQKNSAGSYQIISGSFIRQQYINDRLTVMVFLNGQAASKNLDSSEKISLGGAYGVRAYPKGEASGDSGYLATSELRWVLPMKDAKSGVFQLTAFIDDGAVIINKSPWNGSGINNRHLSGAGLGFIWSQPGEFITKLSYAWKIGSEAAVSDRDTNGRLWLQGTKYF